MFWAGEGAGTGRDEGSRKEGEARRERGRGWGGARGSGSEDVVERLMVGRVYDGVGGVAIVAESDGGRREEAHKSRLGLRPFDPLHHAHYDTGTAVASPACLELH